MKSLDIYIEQAEEVKLIDIAEIEKFSQSHQIASDDSLKLANEFLANVKKAIKQHEERRVDLVGGLKSTVKKIENIFRMKVEPLEVAYKKVADKVLDYSRKRQAEIDAENLRIRKEAEAEAKRSAEAARQADLKRLQDEAEAAKLEASFFTDAPSEQAIEIEKQIEAVKSEPVEVRALEVRPVEIKMQPTRTASGTSSVRKDWTYEVIDMKQLAESRHDLVVDNSVAIRQAIRNGEREIPGLKIYQRETLSMRGV